MLHPWGYASKVDNRLWKWVSANMVNIWAVVAVLLVIITTTVSLVQTPPSPEEPQGLPWLYDLALAYIAGWIFHYLVVVIPEKRKERALLRALRGHLLLIAENGHDLIRDLERIAHCPARAITTDHITKVLTALNDTPAVRAFIASRFRITQEAYDSLIPYMSSLPLPLQVALQRENQRHIHNVFRDDYDPTAKHSLNQLSKESKDVQTLLEFPVTVPFAKREHFGDWTVVFEDYYKSTEAVKVELPKHVLEGDDQPDSFIPATSKKRLLYQPGKDRQNEYFEYPPTATSDKPLSQLPAK